MFEFFWRRDGTDVPVSEIITVNAKKLQLSKIGIEKATGMIAKAIAKSEFIVQRKSGRAKDHVYWMLNVRPNPNETATDFWHKAIKRLLLYQECLIVLVDGNMYVAKDGFQVTTSVMKPQRYSNVTVTSNGEEFALGKSFSADEVMHLKCRNKKIQKFLEQTLQMYDSTATAICNAKKIANAPKYNMKVDGGLPIVRTKNPDGTERTLSMDEYKKAVKRLLESDDIEVLMTQSGLDISSMKVENTATSEDIVKMSNEIYTQVAFAFDIPKAVFLGEITEKADSTNEFITYAVSWIVEIIHDSLNAKLVGEKDYLSGEKIWIDMSRFKHVDIIESANNLDKLRSIGFNFDEVREMIGWEALGDEFSKVRVITKNYTNELGGEGGKE